MGVNAQQTYVAPYQATVVSHGFLDMASAMGMMAMMFFMVMVMSMGKSFAEGFAEEPTRYLPLSGGK